MANSQKPERQNLADLVTVRSVAVGLLIVGVTVSIAGSLLGGKTLLEVVDEFYANAGTELVSIALTVLVIDTLNQRRADRERAHQEAEMRRAEERMEKQALILQMGSPDNAFAVEAARIIRAKGWLHDGTLQNVNLWSACLHGARLREAMLRGAYMCGADLTGAHLAGGNLADADLRQADMSYATLVNVDLSGADLRGARLSGAELTGATLVGVKMDETTILPDNTTWTPETDLTHFDGPHVAAKAHDEDTVSGPPPGSTPPRRPGAEIPRSDDLLSHIKKIQELTPSRARISGVHLGSRARAPQDSRFYDDPDEDR